MAAIAAVKNGCRSHRAPDAEGDASAWGEHAGHLVHRRRAIGEILQTLLAQHHVEAVRIERQRGCVPLAPLDLWVAASRVQHAFVDIDLR